MQTSYWFSVDERLPVNSGVYLACGKNKSKISDQVIPNLYFWDTDLSTWLKKDGKTDLKNIEIIYWTMSDPFIWYEFDYPRSVTELSNAAMAALTEIRDAIDKFNLIQNLSNRNNTN